MFHLLVDSPDCCNIWTWARLKQGARYFIQVSHMDPGAQGLGPSSTALPGTFVGSWTGCGAASTQMRCWCTDSGLTCLHPSTGPEIRWFCVVVSVLPWCAMHLHRTAAQRQERCLAG